MTVAMADFDTIRITAETGAVKHRAACAFEIDIRIGVGRENTGLASPITSSGEASCGAPARAVDKA
jgi:hypothetical protein